MQLINLKNIALIVKYAFNMAVMDAECRKFFGIMTANLGLVSQQFCILMYAQFNFTVDKSSAYKFLFKYAFGRGYGA